MKKLVLDSDEVVLLDEFNLLYSGTLGDEIEFDEVNLTNKRIVCYGSERGKDIIYEIPFQNIKKYKDKIYVDYVCDDNLGDCLRIQTKDGNELFSIDGDDGLFTGNKRTMARINLWISQINDAYEESFKKDNKDKPVEKSIDKSESKNVTDSLSSNSIVCLGCGEIINKNSKFCPSCGRVVNKPKIVEVIKCRNCGTKIDENDRFCPSCGTPVIEEKKEKEKNDDIIKISKCPCCGDSIPSTAIRCPSCGTEIQGRKVASSVKEFAKIITSIDDENKKIEMIKVYPIPNNKEDITEFMYLASTNFDPKIYATNRQDDSVISAWYIKIQQCYKKASSMFEAHDMLVIEKLYKESVLEANRIRKIKMIFRIAGFAGIALGIALIGILNAGKSSTGEEGASSTIHPLSYFGLALIAAGIISLVIGFKRKKANDKIEEKTN